MEVYILNVSHKGLLQVCYVRLGGLPKTWQERRDSEKANLPVPSVSDRRDRQTAAETWRDRRDAKEKKQKCIDVNDVKAKQTMICNVVRYVTVVSKFLADNGFKRAVQQRTVTSADG